MELRLDGYLFGRLKWLSIYITTMISESETGEIIPKNTKSDNHRCLYTNSFIAFLSDSERSILGALCDNYHGDARTTTREAWKTEILIMREILARLEDKDGRIIFEYDIPRLGKRIDVVLLYKGIIFCIEFKAGETKILEADVDQVLDYALDLKNFHKFSQDTAVNISGVIGSCQKTR